MLYSLGNSLLIVISVPPPPPPPLNRRWEVYRPRPGQVPLDALNNWEGFARARVDWQMDTSRAPDNKAIHIATPIIFCDQYHIVAADTMHHVRRVHDHRQDSRAVVEEALQAWLDGKGEVLVDFDCSYHYEGGRYVSWPTRYISRLVYLPIKSCRGQGGSKNEAKTQAALMLLNSHHCMICLSG